MPYKHITKKIPKSKDRRVKLTAQDRLEIPDLYASGHFSQRALAKLYEVSRRLIVFVIYPERAEANYKARVDRGGSKQYYDKDKWREQMRNHRQYKQKLYVAGELEDD